VKILIIDNEEFIRDLFKDICGLVENCECAAAADSRQAYDEISKAGYDILFVDYSLNDGDGISLLWGLRNKGIDTPAYLITGWDRNHFTDQQMSYFTGIMQKPFDIQDVINVIKAHG